jgi:hypothetical protein
MYVYDMRSRWVPVRKEKAADGLAINRVSLSENETLYPHNMGS